MRVYGKADGVDVTFYHVEGDIWKTDVPWKEDGKYIAEIYTEDDAGNVSYLCDMLFVVSSTYYSDHYSKSKGNYYPHDCDHR